MNWWKVGVGVGAKVWDLSIGSLEVALDRGFHPCAARTLAKRALLASNCNHRFGILNELYGQSPLAFLPLHGRLKDASFSPFSFSFKIPLT